jgi:hypothetical protein
MFEFPEFIFITRDGTYDRNNKQTKIAPTLLQTSDSARVEIAQQVAEELKDVIIPEAKSH